LQRQSALGFHCACFHRLSRQWRERKHYGDGPGQVSELSVYVGAAFLAPGACRSILGPGDVSADLTTQVRTQRTNGDARQVVTSFVGVTGRLKEGGDLHGLLDPGQRPFVGRWKVL
jgi:hypothetical protein